MAAAEPTITACILARNEERRIEDALRSLQGWTDEILVIDNESEDGTAALARRYTDRIFTAPRAANFDAARNLAIERAAGGWIFYVRRISGRWIPAIGRKGSEGGPWVNGLPDGETRREQSHAAKAGDGGRRVSRCPARPARYGESYTA